MTDCALCRRKKPCKDEPLCIRPEPKPKKNMKRVCKSNPAMKCVSTSMCYRQKYIRDHACGGCCRELYEKNLNKGRDMATVSEVGFYKGAEGKCPKCKEQTMRHKHGGKLSQ